MAIKFIIADDSWATRTFIRRVLAQGGHEVVGEAKTGAEAVDLYCRLKPDIIIMDLNMPDLDGVEASRRIKESYGHARIIVLTALTNENQEKELYCMGVQCVLLKPFRPDELLKTVSLVMTSNPWVWIRRDGVEKGVSAEKSPQVS